MSTIHKSRLVYPRTPRLGIDKLIIGPIRNRQELVSTIHKSRFGYPRTQFVIRQELVSTLHKSRLVYPRTPRVGIEKKIIQKGI